MRQAARDAVKSVQDALQKLLEKLLAADVETALADPATVAASLENGILHVTVKKRPETQARKIEIS